MAGAPLASGLAAHAARHALLPAGARVIVAVSGGADSTCLAHLLAGARERLGVRVEIAHFNHRLRGRESAADARFAAALARGLSLPFHLGAAAPFSAAERRAASLQELARAQRLAFLLGLARRRRATVALAHTADDQAETVLMRFLAGAGPAGLGGIPPASHGGRLVHPLLFARREAIERWLAARGLRWRTDSSNASRRYLRNRLRLDLLPRLAAFNPRIVERLGALALSLRRDDELLAALAGDVAAAAACGPRTHRFTPQALAAAPAVVARALLAALRAAGRADADFTQRHVEALLAPGEGARAWDLPGGVRASRDPRGLLIAPAPRGRPRPAAVPLARRALRIPGRVALPGGAVLTAAVVDRPPRFDPRRFGADPARVALDLERLRPPLIVRGRVAGDRFQPLGLPAEKKLKELLIDARVPARERPRLPLVCDRDGIVWAAGLRPAERGRVGPETRRLLVLALERPAGPGQSASAGAPPPGRQRRKAVPATSISSSSSASSAKSSGSVRGRTPSDAGLPAAPDGVTSTTSARTGSRRAASSASPSGVRSDSAAGTLTPTAPPAPARDQR
jgi:tRNA(Ile)-lysidine synthase